MKSAALYVRVSTNTQNTDTQLLPLRDYARRRGFTDLAEYVDHGWSGAKRRRPQLDELMKDAKARKFDAVIVARFDRFARSVTHMVNALEEFQALGIDFISLTESIDTSTPMGKMLFSVAAAFGEFERNIIRERILLGIDRARAEGKQLGRPKKIIDRDRVRELKDDGDSIRTIARKLQVSVGFVHGALKTRSKNTVRNFAAGD